MIQKIIIIAVLVVMGLGVAITLNAYQNYRDDRRERVARMQEKAEEVQITIIEGWTIEDVAKYLEKQGLFSAEDFLNAAKKFDYTAFPLIQKPSNATLEGYLFPDTYRVPKQATPELVLAKLLQNFSSRVESLGLTSGNSAIVIPGFEKLSIVGGDGNAGVSLYDILTLAAIIERESGGKGAVSGPLSLDAERGLVAGVFYNRLLIGQALESDATVNYVTGKNSPGVSLKDTEVNSAYNTYKYAGLPPGPIGNPSLGSIRAALKPTTTDYYFFLHKQPSGKVDFSRTFAEHVSKK